jgi:acyl carrier protein
MADLDELTQARQVLKECLDLPELVDQIGDSEDLVLAGVNSGEIIRVAQQCEEILGRPLDDEELTGITSVASVAALLRDGKDA